MECYAEFPRSTVVYNAVTFGGAAILGAVVLAQVSPWALAGYAVFLLASVLSVLVWVCTRCGYYGRRCALGLGRVVAAVFPRRSEDEFLRTSAQIVALLALVVAILLPVLGGVALLIAGLSTLRLLSVAGTVGLLLAGVLPHPRLVCSHCGQAGRGICPLGRQLRGLEGGGTENVTSP